jgi:hypothetical protein
MKAAVVLGMMLLCACGSSEFSGNSLATQINSPQQLIGGSKALGTMGDYLLANQFVRVIVQQQGWSRGFGMFGGGIIDADLVRPGDLQTGAGGNGKDKFGEFFPALFLQAFDVSDEKIQDPKTGAWTTIPGVEIIQDGSSGGPAIVRTRASGGDFLTMVSVLLSAAIPANALRFETDYILQPNARYVEIVGRIINTTNRPIDLSGKALASLLPAGGSGLQLPLGDVALFGAGNKVFAPGGVKRYTNDPRIKPVKSIGFDMHYALDASYQAKPKLPALAGLAVDFLATAGDDVSYGFAAADSDRNYVWLNSDQYGLDPNVKVSKHAMLVPFLLSAFAGAYYEVPPDVLQPRESYEYRRYFIIGDGDVSSIRKTLFELRGTPTGIFSGRVVSSTYGGGVGNISVHILDAQGLPYSQVQTDEAGRFRAPLEPGDYFYVAMAEGRYPYPADMSKTRFTVTTADNIFRVIHLPEPATLFVRVRDHDGRPLPAKVTVVGHYDATYDNLNTQDFLFDFSLGEDRKPSDFSWHEPDASLRQRQYIETIDHTATGFSQALVRPSHCDKGPTCAFTTYDVYVSRGPEYDLFVKRNVDFRAGRRVELEAILHRVVDTSHYLSADLHVHAVNSLDSSYSLNKRVTSAAAEGLEIAVATDHNYITDYRPVIADLHLQDWLKGVVGVELTTMEMGHFNAFPLVNTVGVPSHFPYVKTCYAPDDSHISRTSFDWLKCTPSELFSNVRMLGSLGPDNTIVQVNHPRDNIMGYFNQFYVNPYTAVSERRSGANYPYSEILYPHNNQTHQYEPVNFSYDFDAIEVLNGKHLNVAHAFKLATNIAEVDLAVLQDRCQGGHKDNAPGAVRLRSGGYPAYPGAVDDWLHLLNAGYQMTATGNSDTHGEDDEIGNPRTYFYVAPKNGMAQDQVPNSLDDQEFVSAIKSHRAFLTSAPFLDFSLRTSDGKQWPMGSTVPHVTDPVTLSINLRAAPWVKVDTLVIYANGQEYKRVPVANDNVLNQIYNIATRFSTDTVLVVEAVGSNNLFPVMTPNEDPPLNLGDALASLSPGIGSAGDNISSPSYLQKITPYALTNPIWIDANDNGQFDPPGNTIDYLPDNESTCAKPSAIGVQAKKLSIGSDPHDYQKWDIRKLFYGHAHGH